MSLVRTEPAPRSLREILAPYVAFAAKAFSREATYRMEVFTNVGSLLVRLYLMKAVWTALYAQNVAPAGVPLHAILTYTTVALLMSLLLVRIDVPPLHVLAAFALSFLLGYLVNFFLNFLMNCIAFWTLETFAMQLMVRWVSDLLSGQIVPLIFFPGILQKIVLALPFAAIYSTPLLIYLGRIPPSGYLAAFATQVGWCIAFALLSAVVWRAAQRRIVVQGG